MKKSTGNGEKFYLLYRGICACLNRFLFIILGTRPIIKNKIVVTLSHGKNPGFSCHAKAIIKELLRRDHESEGRKAYKIIWLADDMTKEFPEAIEKVKNNALNRALHLSNAQIWIDSHRKSLGTRKRSGQLYIQTWHGMVGFKAVGKLRGSAFPYIAEKVSRNDSGMIDYILSNSEWVSDVYRRAFFYDGDILKTGSPRCDVLFHSEEKVARRSKIRDSYNIPEHVRIILYAPTFRGGEQVKKLVYQDYNFGLDLQMMLKMFRQHWGGDWAVFYKLHPSYRSEMNRETAAQAEKGIIDVTAADDIYDIMTAADVFISDYSSAAFDAAFSGIPVFLYADDYEKYSNRRGLLWDMDQLPFPFATDNFGMEENIKQFDFDSERYHQALNKLKKEIGVLEDGQASIRVADAIDYFIAFGKKDDSCIWIDGR